MLNTADRDRQAKSASLLGRRIREARKRQGLSQNQLAARAGMAAAMINRVESGARNNLRWTTVVAIAHALGVSLDELANSGNLNRRTIDFALGLIRDNLHILQADAQSEITDHLELIEQEICSDEPAHSRLKTGFKAIGRVVRELDTPTNIERAVDMALKALAV